jgi:hypothetical protein
MRPAGLCALKLVCHRMMRLGKAELRSQQAGAKTGNHRRSASDM